MKNIELIQTVSDVDYKKCLKPFLNQKLILRIADDVMRLETSMENTFQIEILDNGISAYIQDDYTLKNKVKELITKSFIESGYKAKEREDSRFMKATFTIQEKLKVQLAMFYFGGIEKLEITDKMFVINDKYTFYIS